MDELENLNVHKIISAPFTRPMTANYHLKEYNKKRMEKIFLTISFPIFKWEFPKRMRNISSYCLFSLSNRLI